MDRLCRPIRRPTIRTWHQNIANQFSVDGRYIDSEVSLLGDWAIERYDGLLVIGRTRLVSYAPLVETYLDCPEDPMLARFDRVRRLGDFGVAAFARKVADAAVVSRTTGTPVGQAKATIELGQGLRFVEDGDDERDEQHHQGQHHEGLLGQLPQDVAYISRDDEAAGVQRLQQRPVSDFFAVQPKGGVYLLSLCAAML